MAVQIARKHVSKTRHEMTPMRSVGGLSDDPVRSYLDDLQIEASNVDSDAGKVSFPHRSF